MANSFREYLASTSLVGQRVLVLFLTSTIRWRFLIEPRKNCPCCACSFWSWEHFFVCPCVPLPTSIPSIEEFRSFARNQSWKKWLLAFAMSWPFGCLCLTTHYCWWQMPRFTLYDEVVILWICAIILFLCLGRHPTNLFRRVCLARPLRPSFTLGFNKTQKLPPNQPAVLDCSKKSHSWFFF